MVMRGQSAPGVWLRGAWPRVAMEASELWVGFVGAGRMAGGLVRGLLKAGTGWGATAGHTGRGGDVRTGLVWRLPGIPARPVPRGCVRGRGDSAGLDASCTPFPVV